MLRRVLPLVAFAALAALLFAGIVMSGRGNRDALPSPLIGRPAPSFALPDLSDRSRIVRNSDLAGAPYVLNVWGSWCPNCRDDHPVVSALAARGIVKVVGYDLKDDPGDARRWLDELGNPYAVVVADDDGRTAIDWGIYGAPETYLVDARGIVRWKHVGALTGPIVAHDLLPRLAQAKAAP